MNQLLLYTFMKFISNYNCRNIVHAFHYVCSVSTFLNCLDTFKILKKIKLKYIQGDTFNEDYLLCLTKF